MERVEHCEVASGIVSGAHSGSVAAPVAPNDSVEEEAVGGHGDEDCQTHNGGRRVHVLQAGDRLHHEFDRGHGAGAGDA